VLAEQNVCWNSSKTALSGQGLREVSQQATGENNKIGSGKVKVRKEIFWPCLFCAA